MGSLMEHFDIVLKLFGLSLVALMSLLLVQYRQLRTEIQSGDTMLLGRIIGGDVERRETLKEMREVRELVIRFSERLDQHIAAGDVQMADFRNRFERSDTLHIQILTRLGKILNGKTSSPFDAVREGE
jgi:hypothetical protein